MNPVVHFEIPAENGKRMAAFYTKAFGWQTNQMGPEMGNYIVVTTTDSDAKTGRPKNPGAINGGFFQKAKNTTQYPSVVIAVENIKDAMKKVKEAGGKILGGMQKPGQPDNIPGVGLYVSFLDTEGNRIGMLQPIPRN